MELLPNEIIQEIINLACIKKHNNINSKDFLIILKTNQNINKIIENEIITWLTQKLVDFLIILNRNDIINLIYELIEIDENICNEIKILIHFDKCDDLYLVDEDGIICINEYPISNLIESKQILDNLNNEFKYINKIGVSGISEKLMKILWWNMINEDEGYMTYTSYYITKNGIFGEREKSFNFGWTNYPPSQID